MQILQKIIANDLTHPIVFLIKSPLKPFKRLIHIAAKRQDLRDLVGRMITIFGHHLLQQ